MSWALMRHPEGLQIDFFVTHGWAEGIYEFYAKAKRCWQTGKNGWICFLALPQPWSRTPDFKEVIGSAPDMSDAPFVQALEAESCTRMLVVPNATQSIYKRLWCIEEARRAVNRGLEVRLAFGKVEEQGHCPTQRCERYRDERLEALKEKVEQSDCVADRVGAKLEANFHLSAKRIVDKIRGSDDSIRQKAGDELLVDFTSVVDAEASCPEDAERIRAAMRGHEAVIDELIRKLVSQGSVAKFELPPQDAQSIVLGGESMTETTAETTAAGVSDFSRVQEERGVESAMPPADSVELG